MVGPAGGAPLENANPLIYRRSGERPVTAREEDDELPDSIDDREIFDLIRSINDPEHPLTLEELNVVEQVRVKVRFCSLFCFVSGCLFVWGCLVVRFCAMRFVISYLLHLNSPQNSEEPTRSKAQLRAVLCTMCLQLAGVQLCTQQLFACFPTGERCREHRGSGVHPHDSPLQHGNVNRPVHQSKIDQISAREI
uniref:Cytosolic iron-sulfur assembly component 2B n=1 Tax=Anas zonorhyncha TaxID=75864 RepID=A0A8B9VC36_9AVES